MAATTVALLKTALPDVHRIIFDFHVELAYRKAKADIAELLSNGCIKEFFWLLGKVAQRAIDLNEIVYHSPTVRPELCLYEEFLSARRHAEEIGWKAHDSSHEYMGNADAVNTKDALFKKECEAWYRERDAWHRLTIN